jgi:hypothetical protein
VAGRLREKAIVGGHAPYHDERDRRPVDGEVSVVRRRRRAAGMELAEHQSALHHGRFRRCMRGIQQGPLLRAELTEQDHQTVEMRRLWRPGVRGELVHCCFQDVFYLR